MFCGHGLKRAILLLVAVSAVTALFAQTPEYDDYRRISRELADEYMPRIETDSSIFYRAVQATEDIFADVADYQLSFVAFSRRGMPYYRRETVFAGIPVRNEYRSVLDNLLVERRTYSGIRRSEGYVGGAGGFVEYLSDLSEPLSAHSANINFSDRGYWVGVRASVAETFRKGRSLTAFVAGRTGRDLHVKGVFTNAAEAGVKFVKHWDYRNHLTIAAMFSPSERGMRRASVAEAFTLTGDNLYNPSWGYFNGKVRNANVRRSMIPSVVAAFDSEITSRTKLTVAAGVDAGVSKYSALEWYDAVTPLPDNYRYMPSYYYHRTVSDDVTAAWRNNDTKYTQIDWDELYRRNRMSADGHAIYALGDRVVRTLKFNVRATAVTEAGNGLTLGYGAHLSYDDRRNWREMRDLLGADHIVDIDRYLMDDATYGNKLQNNLQNPDRIIGTGDRYGYDYSLVDIYAGAFVTLSRRSNKSRFDFAAEIGDHTVYRRGFYEKELFAGSQSLGRSRKIRLMPYNLKAAYGYSFTPRHYLEVCASYSGEMPDAEDLFLQTQYNNRTVDNPRLRTTVAGELNYTFLHRTIDLKVSLFAMLMRNDCEVQHYYDDLAREYSDLLISGIDKLHYGIELAANIRITRYWSASAAFTAGRYIYYTDPMIKLYADNDNRLLVDSTPARVRSCHDGNTPQIAGTAEVTYMKKGWGVRMSLNYAGLRYVEPALIRRTDRVSHQAANSVEMFRKFVTQERLPDAATVDVSVWRMFWLKRDYKSRSRIVVALSAKNLIGSKYIVYSARESMRIHRRWSGGQYLYSPFETTYLYSYPRTFRLSATYRF